MAKGIKDRLLKTLEELPERSLEELLAFTEFLLERERYKTGKGLDLDPRQDPILEYIGGVSHGSLAKEIDRELYGEGASSSSSIHGVGLRYGIAESPGTRK